jgi:hypothetical protein
VGRRKGDGNHTPQKNNPIQDSVGNDENGYPVPDPNKARTNVTGKLIDAPLPPKKPKRTIWKKLLRNS